MGVGTSQEDDQFKAKEMNIENLPQINIVVSAKCKRINGEVETHLIRRIKTKDTSKGWQWSHAEINTYFTLEVISWEN